MENRRLDALLQPTPLDLRRRDRQDLARRIAHMAEWLPQADRALLRAVYDSGQPVADLARIAGQHPRSLRRRVRRLTARVLSSRYLFVVSHMADWPATRRKVARACVIQGLSMRAAARQLGLSLHTVRMHHAAIRALAEGAAA